MFRCECPLCYLVAEWIKLKRRFQFSAAFRSGANCITIALYPKNNGAAVYSRCAMQKSDFPLQGNSTQPNIGRRLPSTHYWPLDEEEVER